MVVTVLMSSAGGRYVTGLTIAPSRIRRVVAARNESTAYASSIGSVMAAEGAAWIRWSVAQTVCRPRSSAAWPRSARAAGMPPDGYAVMLTLTSMAHAAVV